MPLDTYQRPLTDLRISVTDRCNFRCTYCMPLDEYDWLGKKEILTFEEIVGWPLYLSNSEWRRSGSLAVSPWCARIWRNWSTSFHPCPV